MKTLTINKDVVLELSLDGEVDEQYTMVALEYLGDWRWGTEHRLVIQDQNGSFWAIEYREQSGDNYYNSLDDEVDEEGNVELYEVVPEQIVTTVYRRPNV